MGVTLDFSRARRADVVVGCSPLLELMAALHVVAEPDHHPESAEWLGALSAQVSVELAGELTYFAPLWARYRCPVFFPTVGRLGLPLEEELARIHRLPTETFIDLVCVGVLGSPTVQVPPAGQLLSDARSRAEYLAQCARRSHQRTELARALLADADGFRHRLLTALDRCADEFFTKRWRELAPALGSVVEKVRRQLAERPPAEVVGQLAPAATHHPGRARVRFDKLQLDDLSIGPRPLLVVPSAHVWPHVTVKDEDPACVVLHVPVPELAPFPLITLRQLHDRLSALSSPGRMELCRHLLAEPSTISELASRMGRPQPHVSRMLRQLRDAGLVRSERDGRWVRHRLDTEVLRRLGPDVLTTITR